MYQVLKTLFLVCLLLASYQSKAQAKALGNLSGRLILDDSWERQIYISLIEGLNNEYKISNSQIVASSVIDENGNFNIKLDTLSQKWSLLRLHVAKKGITPNSLTIGSINENFMFLIAKNNSEIKIFNTATMPIFRNVRIEGANYMKTFEYIKGLVEYPNSIDYENTMIEKEFIVEAVSEKLKTVADTCSNPLVSLYAIYKTDFQSDLQDNKLFYDRYLTKWKTQNDMYFNAFTQNFSNDTIKFNSNEKYNVWFWPIAFIVFALALVVFLIIRKRTKSNINELSVKEREIFGLLQQGMSNKEIAAECNIELTTVKSHIGSIYTKLKIKSRKEALNIKTK
ncbi:helix-turn-helix domain-containing protein [Lacinutrix salivirga]